VEVDHPAVGKHLRYGGLVEFSLTPGLYRASAQIVQHTRPVLRELGYDDRQIEALGRQGVVQWADPADA
jgi:crotonobetainyl-CoA:carnitine CoA-transferase CaiB-like acyl-CoA transferase